MDKYLKKKSKTEAMDSDMSDDDDFMASDDDSDFGGGGGDDDDSDDDDYGEEQENRPPKPRAKKKADAAKPKASALKAADAEEKEDKPPKPKAKSTAKSPNSKTIEETYQKKTPREHVLLRPDTYIGSIERETQKLWVFDKAANKMVLRDVSFVPGLHKIFDEILVNAADNKQRDKNMKALSVDINKEEGSIVVYNDGKGIPVKLHSQHNVYIPELIFGHMLTSSNFDDTKKRVVGGRNGYGAKLANIYSKEFIVETNDGKKSYRQRHWNNMTQKGKPRVKEIKSKKQWTRITFKPDFARFGMEGFDDDCIALLTKRVYDLAGVTDKSVKVKLNGELIPVNCFKDFLSLYVMDSMPILHCKVNDRWEIGVSMTDGHFQQVSYVNSISTTSGGKHVDHVCDNITKYLLKAVEKKNPDMKPRHIKDFMFVFVNSLIENPAFKSQTKTELVTKVRQFGTTCDIPEAFLKKLQKSEIVKEAVAMVKHKESRKISRKTDGKKTSRLTGVPKLEDANLAGTKESLKCTLILTEGDSAKALAVSGISVVGRDHYGVFPLKGKMLNVRDAKASTVANNNEIMFIKKIIGLRDKMDYSDEKNFSTLRYGRVMIMTDQDHDGSHIKGLVINFFHNYWPTLLRRPRFLVEFITPIVVAKKKRGNLMETFYTLPEYQEWKRNNNNGEGWSVKYYKGLGTSTALEAKKYFQALGRHKINFKYQGPEDDSSITLAFSNKEIENRKRWLGAFEPGTFLDQNVASISYHEFVHKELILFSMADNARSIPSMVDGLKPGQRKILFCAFKKNLKKEVKVAQFAGYVGEKSAYHHGEISLTDTIVKMAQNFVGSNNINLMFPSGQFGTRNMGGKDAASSRYIFTRLCKITRTIFPEEDDQVLNYLDDDGMSIEPEWYVPVLPMALVNGADGIGTGWSTSVPNYNPRELVRNLKLMLDGNPQQPLNPWFKGWTGVMRRMPTETNYAMVGRIAREDDHTLRITELPIGKWTQNYKDFLETLIEKKVLTDIKCYHTDNAVNFLISTDQAHPITAITEHVLKAFRLTGKVQVGNMVLFDEAGKLCRYDSAEQILEAFYKLRLNFYVKRKAAQISQMEEDVLRLDNRIRFILDVISGRLKINNRPKKEIFAYLRKNKYTPFPKKSKKAGEQQNDAEEDEYSDDDEDEEDVDSDGDDDVKVSQADERSRANEHDYDYLLSMPIWSLTMERVKKLKAEQAKKTSELVTLRETSETTMWRRDLERFEVALDNHDKEEKKMRERDAKLTEKQRKRQAKQKKLPRKKPKVEKKFDADGNPIKPKAAKPGFFIPTAKAKSTMGTVFEKLMGGADWAETDFATKSTGGGRGRKKIKLEDGSAAVTAKVKSSPSSKSTSSTKSPTKPSSSSSSTSTSIKTESALDPPSKSTVVTPSATSTSTTATATSSSSSSSPSKKRKRAAISVDTDSDDAAADDSGDNADEFLMSEESDSDFGGGGDDSGSDFDDFPGSSSRSSKPAKPIGRAARRTRSQAAAKPAAAAKAEKDDSERKASPAAEDDAAVDMEDDDEVAAVPAPVSPSSSSTGTSKTTVLSKATEDAIYAAYSRDLSTRLAMSKLKQAGAEVTVESVGEWLKDNSPNPPKAASGKKAKSPAKSKSSSSSSSSSSYKPASKLELSPAARKPTKAAAPAVISDDDDDESDADVEMKHDGLEEKPAKTKAAPKRKLTKRKAAAGEGTKAAKPKTAAAASKKRKAIEIIEDSDDEPIEPKSKKKKTTAAAKGGKKPGRATKQTTLTSLIKKNPLKDSSDASSSSSSSVKSKGSKAKSKGSTKSKHPAISIESDSDSDDDVVAASQKSTGRRTQAVSLRGRSAKAAATKKKTKSSFDFSDEEESDDGGGDESDFANDDEESDESDGGYDPYAASSSKKKAGKKKAAPAKKKRAGGRVRK